eukprot:scaffold53196_cov28-Tisochrysis_lutea.AAC.7
MDFTLSKSIDPPRGEGAEGGTLRAGLGCAGGVAGEAPPADMWRAESFSISTMHCSLYILTSSAI